MRNILLAGLLAAALVSGPAAPALARAEAETPSARVQDAHADLYAATSEAASGGQQIEVTLDAMERELVRSTPEIEALEQEKPGLLAALREAMRPVMSEYAERTHREFEPRITEITRELLTDEEAAQAAAFYRTPLGAKVLRGDGAQGPEVSAAADGGANAQGTLTAQERSELERIYRETPGLRKLAAGQERIRAVRKAMADNPLTADEEARLMEAIAAAFEAHFPAQE